MTAGWRSGAGGEFGEWPGAAGLQRWSGGGPMRKCRLFMITTVQGPCELPGYGSCRRKCRRCCPGGVEVTGEHPSGSIVRLQEPGRMRW